MKFNKKELDMLIKSVKLYEENYWMSEGREWQNIINSLIEKLKKEVKNAE